MKLLGANTQTRLIAFCYISRHEWSFGFDSLASRALQMIFSRWFWDSWSMVMSECLAHIRFQASRDFIQIRRELSPTKLALESAAIASEHAVTARCVIVFRQCCFSCKNVFCLKPYNSITIVHDKRRKSLRMHILALNHLPHVILFRNCFHNNLTVVNFKKLARTFRLGNSMCNDEGSLIHGQST